MNDQCGGVTMGEEYWNEIRTSILVTPKMDPTYDWQALGSTPHPVETTKDPESSGRELSGERNDLDLHYMRFLPDMASHRDALASNRRPECAAVQRHALTDQCTCKISLQNHYEKAEIGGCS
jgi:hypothetical protein